MTEHTVPDIFHDLVHHVDRWLGDDDPDTDATFERYINAYVSSLPQEKNEELTSFLNLILTSKNPASLFDEIWNQMGTEYAMSPEGYPLVFREIRDLLTQT